MRHSHGITGHKLIDKILEAGLRPFAYAEYEMSADRCVAARVNDDDDDRGIPRGNFVIGCALAEIWYWQ